MTRESMLNVVKQMSGETDYDTLNAYLDLAETKVLARCYPFDATKTEVPARYQQNVIEITCLLLDRRGSTGEVLHDENGIKRTYEAASVPDSMLKSIVPFVKVV